MYGKIHRPYSWKWVYIFGNNTTPLPTTTGLDGPIDPYLGYIFFNLIPYDIDLRLEILNNSMEDHLSIGTECFDCNCI